MPLLNKKPLEFNRYNKKLRDDAEVFYCKCTNEVFEDYEEYCQRVISCNSLIWTCSITGKSNLTYEEALESEENALKLVKDFPHELRTPILYLATKTNRRNFNDLVNDVFNFAKDRYFLGESVEVNFDGVWLFGHVLQVLPPEPEEVEEYKTQNDVTGTVSSRPYPSCLYRYEVEQIDDDTDVSEIRTLPWDKIRRFKGVFTREKCRIFLKQYVEPKKEKWRIQSNILAKYGIANVSFSQLFVGENPEFQEGPLTESKLTQQTLDGYLTKNPEKMKPRKMEAGAGKKGLNLKNIHKKYETTIDKVVQQSRRELMKQEFLEEKARKREEEREQKRVEKAKLANFVKEWQQKRDDLECEDLRELPEACPVSCRVPNEHFGDVVQILEFFSSFHKVLKVKDYFPFGLKFELLERALVEEEIAGPLSDILQLLLTTLFTLQEQEDDEIRSTVVHPSTELKVSENGDISTEEIIKQATIASSWSRLHHGVALNQLSLDAITVSEVLRLHLLGSGARAGDRGSKWRYQERGGYHSTDDPCFTLRMKYPHILRVLAVKTVGELPVDDKIKVLSCLMNQILTYAELRDVIEERHETLRSIKSELRNDQLVELKKEKELSAQKVKEKKEAKEKGETVPEETEEEKQKGEKESKRKKAEFHRREIQLQKAAMDCHIMPLGQDRSYRRFWVFTTIGGLFVEDGEEFPGSCLPEPTPVASNMLEEDTMSYLKKLFEEERNCGSDKENEGNSSHPIASPKKKLLSESNDLTNTFNPVVTQLKQEEERKVPDFLCTANRETCPVHSCRKNKTRWSFYYKETDLNELINCLNKRGDREHRLRKALMEKKDYIIPQLGQCPVKVLNRFLITDGTWGLSRREKGFKNYVNANLKFPPGTPVNEILELYIRELILDTEEKIYCGGLGSLKVKDRQAWRKAIDSRSYDRQDDALTWPEYPIKMKMRMRKEEDEVKKEEEDGSRPDTPCSMESGPEQEVLEGKTDQNHVVKDLASAVLQVARSVEAKFLQKPLLEDKKKMKTTVMERWESSLMTSTSFAQVYLHVATLENSIQWNRSLLNARCKICRRGGDGENMLLCDNCDRGFHLYCLKPKLTSIPKGDWFCLACRPKEKVEKTRRARKPFSEDSDEEDERPLAETRSRRSRQEEAAPASRKRKHRRLEEEEEDDEEDDSGDEPLSKIARTSRRSAQRKDVD